MVQKLWARQSCRSVEIVVATEQMLGDFVRNTSTLKGMSIS